jgi:hypothetical protein
MWSDLLKTELYKDKKAVSVKSKKITLKMKLKKLFLSPKELERINTSMYFYSHLFKNPVRKIFYWSEENWDGGLFVVYSYDSKKYGTIFIYSYGNFGTCEMCDPFPRTQELSEKFFDSLVACNNLNDIILHEYSHPDLVEKFNKFKSSQKNIKI